MLVCLKSYFLHSFQCASLRSLVLIMAAASLILLFELTVMPSRKLDGKRKKYISSKQAFLEELQMLRPKSWYGYIETLGILFTAKFREGFLSYTLSPFFNVYRPELRTIVSCQLYLIQTLSK